VCALLMLAANFAIGVVGVNGYQLFIGRLHWTYTDLAVLTGGWGLAVGGGIAALTGFVTDKVGSRTVAAIAASAIALGWVTFAQLEPYWTDHTLVYFAGFWEATWQAALSVALIALCMDLSSPKVAGSQFAAYMALSNFSTTLGYQFGAQILNKLGGPATGFPRLYMVMAAVQLAIVPLLIPIDPHQLRRSLADGGTMKRNDIGLAAFLLVVAFLVVMTVRQTIKIVG